MHPRNNPRIPPPVSLSRSKRPRRLIGLSLLFLALAALLLSSSPQAAQAQTGPTKLWESTMTVGSGTDGLGYYFDSTTFEIVGAFQPEPTIQFSTHTSSTRFVNSLLISGDNNVVTLAIGTPYPDTFSGVLCADGLALAFDQDSLSTDTGHISSSDHPFVWTAGQQVELSIWEVPAHPSGYQNSDYDHLCGASPGGDPAPGIDIETETEIWSTTLVAGTDGTNVGFSDFYGYLGSGTFLYEGGFYIVRRLFSWSTGVALFVFDGATGGNTLPEGMYRLYIGDTGYDLGGAPASPVAGYTHHHDQRSPVMAFGQSYTVRLVSVSVTTLPAYTEIWSSSLYAGQSGQSNGYFPKGWVTVGGLDPNSFVLGGKTYNIRLLASDASRMEFKLDQSLPEGDYHLYAGDAAYNLESGSGSGAYSALHGKDSSLFRVGGSYNVRLVSGKYTAPQSEIPLTFPGDDDTVTACEGGRKPITYQPKRSSNTISLNDLVPSGVFDRSYMRRSDGKYIPYEWQWEQTSGPDMDLVSGGYLFTLPDLPHCTTLDFRVTATNADEVEKSYDLLLVVNNPGNTDSLQAPVAEAGADISKRAGKVVQLDGSGSRSPTGDWRDLSFRWDLTHAPPRLPDLNYRDEKAPFYARFVMPELYTGEYLEFTLTATIWGQSDSDTLRVTDSNALPAANAGPDQDSAPGQRVTLSGSATKDRKVQASPSVTYSWVERPRSTVSLHNAKTEQPWFILPPESSPGQSYHFEMVVTDGQGRQASDMTTVTALATTRPTACAGEDLTGAPGETVTLQGQCSTNPTGPWHRLAHAWSQTGGPPVTLSGVNRGDPSFTIPTNATDGTTLEFKLTVTAEDGQSDSDTVVVTVDSTPEATPPTACAGDDLEAQPGDELTLEGTCSTNPHGIWWRMAHLWTQPAGQNIVLTNPTKGKPSFTVPTDAAPGTVYTFTLTVTDQDGESDSDDMTVTVPGDTGDSQTVDPPPNGAPVFDDGIATTRSIPENSAAGTKVGAAVTATDPDDDKLTYSLSGTDAASFGIDSKTGQITTIEGVTYDFETKVSYSLSVDANDGNGGAASIPITVKLTDVDETPPNSAPTFDDGSSATRSIAENSPAGTDVGAAITATDPDNDKLTYSLSGTDAASFAIDTDSGQLQTKSGVTYDFEAKASYSLTVSVRDGNGGTASIAVTVRLTDVYEPPPNGAPVFSDGSSATRSIAENSPAGTKVGAAIAATDPDNDKLTYSLSGTDAASFALDTDTGQLQTKSGVTYDFEAKVSYSLTVSVRDGNGGTASIAVTVRLTDVDETPPNGAPVFSDGSSATRSIAENSPAGTKVGAAIAATDPDNDKLTYSLSGTDAASFALDTDTGQLQTKSGVTYDFEAKVSYSLTVSVRDGNGGTASIAVTVRLTDVDETPPEPEATPVTACFTSMGTLSSAAEYAGAWDDANCNAHHQDGRARYFHFTLSEAKSVSISLSSGALYVSRDTPKNGWGTVPGPGYEHRKNVRRDNGKLVHDGGNSVTLTLDAGETYMVEAAGTSGDFTLNIDPQ